MQLLCLALILISITGGQQQCCYIQGQECLDEEPLICKLSTQVNNTINCVIYENNITAVNEGIRVCSRKDSSILGMNISITSPLSGDIRLDMLADSILYLVIYNQRVNQNVNITATNEVPNLRTLATSGIGSFTVTSSTFFSQFLRIEKITLTNTSFYSPPSFSPLHTLTYLGIYQSTLSHYSNVHVGEEFVGGLDQLKYLFVSSLQSTVSLSELAFRGLTSLTALFLPNNNIRSISENQFRDSRALTYISLSHNNITFLSSKTFQQLLRLASVDVSDNPLNCSCPLQWMSVDVNKSQFCYYKPTCQYPHKFVNETATSPSIYQSCPPLSLSLQCLNRSNPLCPSSLSCYDTATSYQCSACPPGYGQVSDSECVDLDACSRAPSPCGDNTTCVNTVGSFMCLSPSNPCDTRNGGCEQKCEFNGSSHRCSCHAGFKFENVTKTCVSDATDTTYQIKIAYSVAGAAVTLSLIPWIIIILKRCRLCKWYKYCRFIMRHTAKEQGIEMTEIIIQNEERIGMINNGMEQDDEM